MKKRYYLQSTDNARIYKRYLIAMSLSNSLLNGLFFIIAIFMLSNLYNKPYFALILLLPFEVILALAASSLSAAMTTASKLTLNGMGFFISIFYNIISHIIIFVLIVLLIEQFNFTKTYYNIMDIIEIYITIMIIATLCAVIPGCYLPEELAEE